ncbi:hypothetical protein CDFC105_53657 [Clostridioides difficile]|nr:transcriptional regulator [Clostridioides difficile]CZR82702.1 hypothetical protein CDFC105_53657 [Clostridioides difficile]
MEKVKCNEFKRIEEKLYNYNRLKAEINYLNLEIKSIENLYIGCKGIEYMERTGTSYNINSSVENEIFAKEKNIEQIKRKIRGKEILIEKIDNAILLLSEDEMELVKYRYFKNNTWNYVANRIGFSVIGCKQMRVSILNKIKDLLN